MRKKRIGISTNTIHAPCVNFVTVTTMSTTAVIPAPMALITRARRIAPCESGRASSSVRADGRFALPAGCRRSDSSRSQCRTMPVWPSVNDTNTPMMYSWMSTVRFAWNTTRITDAASARITTPFE